MSLSAKEAAEAVGLTKQAIIKAIHRGDLSATKTTNGEYRIEPVELYRVWPPRPLSATSANELSTVDPTPSTIATEVSLLRELLAAKDDVIDDLRHRLDAEADERRRLTALITTTQVPAPTPRVSLWRWLFPKRSHE